MEDRMREDSLMEITEEQIARAAVLLRSRGRNSYEYLSRQNVRVCPACGEVFETLGRGRPKRFCSDECRMKYHHKHPTPENWKSTRLAVCPVCGREFQASREYRNKRIYCSHACANRGRAMKKNEQVKEEQENDGNV